MNTLNTPPKHQEIRLNLGCWKDIREGYINADILPCADVQCDLGKFPWPWPDNYADEILMWHVLEHMPDVYATMAEVKRILKPGGRFVGQVPYCYSQLAFNCAQHYHYFSDKTIESIASDFDMELINAKLGVHTMTLNHRLRNLIPFRKFLSLFLLNMWDIVDFEMRKRLHASRPSKFDGAT